MQKIDNYVHLHLLKFLFPNCILNTEYNYLASVSKFWKNSISKYKYSCLLNVDNPNFISKIGKVPQYCTSHNIWMKHTMSQLKEVANDSNYFFEKKYSILFNNIKETQFFEDLIHMYDLNIDIKSCHMNGKGCNILLH